MPTHFTYQKSRPLQRVLLVVTLISVAVAFFSPKGGNPLLFGLLILLTSALLVGIGYLYLFNRSFRISGQALTVKRKIGRSKHIPFRELRRVLVREEPTTEGLRMTMLLFSASGTTKIVLSDLTDRSALLRLVEERGRSFGFPVVYQDAAGRVLGSVAGR